MRTLKNLLIFGCALAFCSAPLWPKFGVVKTHARFAIYHPPAFHTPGRELRLAIDSIDMRTGGMMVPRIQHFLEEALTAQGFKISPAARTVLQCTLTDSTAALETVQRPESLNIHTGEHTEEKNGKKKQVEDCKNQTVTLTYLVSSGHLAMEVKAADGQSLLMNQMVERSYRQESAISGPQKCGGETYNVQKGQLQDAYAILGQLGDQAVSDTAALVTGYDEARDVLLAVDDELKPGNAQAQAGNWTEALASWANATMRSAAGEAARQYNLGVAHEMMAGAAMHNWAIDEASNHLAQAQECYAAALKTDPEEKYFRDTLARIQTDQNLLHQQQDQASQDQSASSHSMTTGTTATDASLAIPLDGWPEGESASTHDYRVYVRTRLSASKGQPTDALRRELKAAAGDYDLDPTVATGVLDTEAQRLAVVQHNMAKYREDYAAARSSGSISPDGREMLRKRQQILHLSDDQVREIESQFPSQDDR